MSLRIVKPGVYSTVQDLGRPGHASRGVPAGGAADRLSLVLANRLVGNPDDAAAIEMTLVGATIAFERGATVALAGAAPGGAAVHQAMNVGAGATLALGPLRGGARTYLAVAGGVDVPLVLASRSTHVASGLGGYEGRPLRALDVLAVGASASRRDDATVEPDAIAPLVACATRKRLRVVAGPHAEMLGAGALEALLASEFTVSDRSDRVGVRLVDMESGADARRRPLRPALATAAAQAGEMITEPMSPGAIQVPPDGAPIILGPDAPVTGGYLVAGTVIAADLPALGQLAPRERITFELVTLADALGAYRALAAILDAAASRAAPANNNPSP